MFVALACGSSGTTVSTPEAKQEEQPSEDEISAETESQTNAEEPTPESLPTSTEEPTLAPLPTSTEKPTEEAPLGTRRDNPAPVGSEVLSDDMKFLVLSVIRPADDVVKKGNQFNSDAEEGKEYLFIEISITCALSNVEKCSFNTFTLKALGSLGIEYDAEWFVSGVDGLLESTEFYGDSTITGYVPFIVGIDETDVLLVYEPILWGDTFYLSLPSPE